MPADEASYQQGCVHVVSYSVSLAAKAVGVSQRQLYYWESIGIVSPIYERFGSYSYRRYSQNDIDLLAKVKSLLDAGYTLRAATQKAKGNSNDLTNDHDKPPTQHENG